MSIYSQNYATKEVKEYQQILASSEQVYLSDLNGVKGLKVITFEGYRNNFGTFNPTLVLQDTKGKIYNVEVGEMSIRAWKKNLYNELKKYNVFIKDIFNSLTLKY